MNKYNIYLKMCKDINIQPYSQSKFYELLKSNSIWSIVEDSNNNENQDEFNIYDLQYIKELWIDELVEQKAKNKYMVKKFWPDWMRI